MARGDLPHNVTVLVADCLSSITQLDLLLHLHATPDRTFGAEDLGRRMRLPARMVTGQLVDLAAAGLVTADEQGWRFHAAGPRAGDVDDLAEAAARRRRAVQDLILAGPSDDVQLFSDAFRLRRGGPR